MAPPLTVEAYLAALDAPTRAAIDALRSLIRAAHPGLDETIKWNAPSYSLDGEDRVTLGLERQGGYRIVLHRGAKPQATAAFRFEDDTGLAVWPAPDRGVVRLADGDAIAAKREALTRLVGRWIAAA